MPQIAVRLGDPQEIVRTYLSEREDIAALVLGASSEGGPGPLVSHFSAHAGSLPCPLYIIPGGLDRESLDRLA